MKTPDRKLCPTIKTIVTAIAAMFVLLPEILCAQTAVPTGNNIEVSPADGTTGQTPLTLFFPNVSQPGTASLQISDTGPALPPGYYRDLPVAYYQVTVNANYVPVVNVRINYDPASYRDEANLRIFFYTSGQWEDRTISLDNSGNTITARVADPDGIYVVLEGGSGAIEESQTILASDPSPGAGFGNGLAIDGDRAVFGARHADSGPGYALARAGLMVGDPNPSAIFGGGGRLNIFNANDLNPRSITMEALVKWKGPNGFQQRVLEKSLGGGPGIAQYNLTIRETGSNEEGEIIVELFTTNPAGSLSNVIVLESQNPDTAVDPPNMFVMSPNQVSHIVATFDQTWLRLYADGELVSERHFNVEDRKALWVWHKTMKAPDGIDESLCQSDKLAWRLPDEREKLIERCVKSGVNKLYLAFYLTPDILPPHLIPTDCEQIFPEGNRATNDWPQGFMIHWSAIRDIIGKAHDHGIEVWAAGGAPDWADGWIAAGCDETGCDEGEHPFARGRFDDVMNYNQQNPDRQFDGFIVDVESVPDFQNLLRFYEGALSHLKGDPLTSADDLPLAIDISAYWDGNPNDPESALYYPVGCNDPHCWKPVYQHIMDLQISHVVIDSYWETGQVITAITQDEIDYADALKKYGFVVTGVETQNWPDGRISFYEEGQNSLRAELQVVRESFSANPSFGGVMIHHYLDSYLGDLPLQVGGEQAWPATDPGEDPEVPGILLFVDSDGDGIADAVDLQPYAPSTIASDVHRGGVTTLTVLDPGGTLEIRDVYGIDPVTNKPFGLHVCGDAGTKILDNCTGSVLDIPLPSKVLTSCGSIKIDVLTGGIDVHFPYGTGQIATASIQTGNALLFEPLTASLEADPDNSGVIDIVADGNALVHSAGESELLQFKQPPAPSAGPDQVVECQDPVATPVTLDGSATVDPNGLGDIVSYQWSESATALGQGSVLDVLLEPGLHIIHLTVTDAIGNQESDHVVIEVVDTTPPVLTLSGDLIQRITTGDPYLELGAAALDACAGDLGASVTVDASAVDTSTAGTYLVHYEVTDPAGNTATVSRTVIVGIPPLVDPGGPYAVNEGSQVTVTATGSDPDGDSSALVFAWDLDDNGSFESTGHSATFDAAQLDGPSTHPIRVQVTDEDGFTAVGESLVEVLNVAPLIEAISGPADPLELGTEAQMCVEFSDAAAADTHTVEWDWGDDTTSPGFIDPACPGTAGSHFYLAPGVYTITAIVTDDDHLEDVDGNILVDGRTTAVFEFIVIYDPEGGFVTGGGFVDSPPGAYAPDPSLAGTANFGFVSKYKKGATVPTGETEFNFHLAGLNFHSSSYDWLVVAGAKAIYKGDGSVNGLPGYKFMLSAIDGSLTGGGVDRFRIKIWESAGGGVLYDNQMGAGENDDPTTAIAGGNIKIHKAK